MPKLHRLQAHEDLTAVLDGVEPRAIDLEAMLSAWARQWFLQWPRYKLVWYIYIYIYMFIYLYMYS